MKDINVYIWENELTHMIEESKQTVKIKDFNDLSIMSDIVNGFNVKKNDYICFYKTYKGNHVYLDIRYTDGCTDVIYVDLEISSKNKKPGFLNKTRYDKWADKNKGEYIQFRFSPSYEDAEVDYNKELVDKYFGKQMPHMSGDNKHVSDSLDEFLAELASDGGSEWQVVKIS